MQRYGRHLVEQLVRHRVPVPQLFLKIQRIQRVVGVLPRRVAHIEPHKAFRAVGEMHRRMRRFGVAPEGIDAAVRGRPPVLLPPGGELHLPDFGLQPDVLPHCGDRHHIVLHLRQPAHGVADDWHREPVGVAGFRQQFLRPFRVVPVQLLPGILPLRVIAGVFAPESLGAGYQPGHPPLGALPVKNVLPDGVPVNGLVHRLSHQLARIPRRRPRHRGVVRRRRVGLKFRPLFGGKVQPAEHHHAVDRRNLAFRDFQPVVQRLPHQRPVDGRQMRLPRQHRRQPRGRFLNDLDFNGIPVRIHPVMIPRRPFPQPADALLKVGELVGPQPRRAFRQQRVLPRRAVPLQMRRHLRERFVIRRSVGAARVPLRLAGNGQAPVARNPVVKNQLRPGAHINVDFLVADHFRHRPRVRAEIVGIRRSAGRVGVVIQRIHDVVSRELPVAEVEIDARTQLEIPGAPVLADAPVGSQLRLQRPGVAVGVQQKLMRRAVLAGGAPGDIAVHNPLPRLLRKQENQVLRL